MHKLSGKLRIGEKIGLSFGVVGLLFLLVIWRYHVTLEHALSDYRILQEIYEAKETHAGEIEVSLLKANAEATAFLADRAPDRPERIDAAIAKLLDSAQQLGEIDAEGQAKSNRVTELAHSYQQRFHEIHDAWERKGLDHDSGLQGAFRDTVHELETLAGYYDVDALYIYLLQIRRSEKDLGLRREPDYRQRVLALLDGFTHKLASSQLEPAIREKLDREIGVYRETFLAYAERALNNEDIEGGKGPFRQAAHRIEDILNAHRVPDMKTHILQLRRREKDYLLRLDPTYVDMAIVELQYLDTSVGDSLIADTEKAQLRAMLSDYRRDFLALVEQNRLIGQLQQEMGQAATEVLALADATEATANKATEEATSRINEEAERNARLMGWIVLLAVLLAVVLGTLITRLITRPLIQMAGFLDRLAFDAPVGRIPTVANSRNEVAAMAESVNRMADHKANMIAWWKSSLEEMEAERDRLEAESESGDGEEPTAAEKYREAAAHRAELLTTSHRRMQQEAGLIQEAAGQMGEAGKPVSVAAREILSQLDVLLAKKPD
jgi:methyl-accepting chemotaxis protein